MSMSTGAVVGKIIQYENEGDEDHGPTTSSSNRTENNPKLQYRYGTRNVLDLKVGKSHIIQLQFHLRTSDLDWFNDCNCTSKYMRQLIQIVSRTILPYECEDEIEASFISYSEKNQSSKSGGTESATSSGTKRKQTAKKSTKKKGDGISSSKKLKGIGSVKSNKTVTKTKNKSTKPTQKGHKTKRANKVNDSDNDDNNESKYLSSSHFKSGNTFLYGEDIQILYKMEHVDTSNYSILQFVTPDNHHEQHESGKEDECSTRTQTGTTAKAKKQINTKPLILSKFQCLKPLSKRIILWCYPFDPNDFKAPDMASLEQTFPRPELIPISNLFHDKP